MPKLEAKRGYPGESMRKKREIFGNFFGHGKIEIQGGQLQKKTISST